MNKSLLILLLLTLVSFSVANRTFAQEVNNAKNEVLVSENSIHNTEHELPNPIMVIPFVILLIMIATGPILYPHFWEYQYPKISILLGTIVVIYYSFFLHNTSSLLHTAAEYFSFIVLLASLFFASGEDSFNACNNSGVTMYLPVIARFDGAIFGFSIKSERLCNDPVCFELFTIPYLWHSFLSISVNAIIGLFNFS